MQNRIGMEKKEMTSISDVLFQRNVLFSRRDTFGVVVVLTQSDFSPLVGEHSIKGRIISRCCCYPTDLAEYSNSTDVR